MRPPVKMSRSDRLGSFPPFVHRFVHRRMHYGEVSGWGSSVQQTTDGGFIVTGYDTEREGEGESYSVVALLLKTDGQGNEQWRKNFGYGKGRSVQQMVDGGFIIVGENRGYNRLDHSILFLNTDKLGNMDADVLLLD